MPVNKEVILGENVKIYHPDLVNIYGCKIDKGTTIGPFVEIQKGAVIGKRCKISSHSFICDGVTIEDEVFIGHGVMFVNDLYPRAVNTQGELQTEEDWVMVKTQVCRGVTIGSNATILGGVTIGNKAIVGAGSVVTKDVPERAVVIGNPARIVRFINKDE